MTKGIIWKKKSTNTFHPLTPLYTYCHMQLRCNYFGHNFEDKSCDATCLNIWLFKIIIIIIILLLLLFWNNLRRSIQILGWFYIMTRGPM